MVLKFLLCTQKIGTINNSKTQTYQCHFQTRRIQSCYHQRKHLDLLVLVMQIPNERNWQKRRLHVQQHKIFVITYDQDLQVLYWIQITDFSQVCTYLATIASVKNWLNILVATLPTNMYKYFTLAIVQNIIIYMHSHEPQQP